MMVEQLEGLFDKASGEWDVLVPQTEPDGSDSTAYVAWLLKKQAMDKAAEDSRGALSGMQQQVWNLR